MAAYETDTYAWALGQAQRLRSGEPVDVEHIAEEIEDLGKRQKAYLLNNLAVLIRHMLKWDYQADGRKKGWQYSISEHRRRVNRHLKENPSLKPVLLEILEDAYLDGRLQAAIETGLDLESFPSLCPYEVSQILGSD